MEKMEKKPKAVIHIKMNDVIEKDDIVNVA